DGDARGHHRFAVQVHPLRAGGQGDRALRPDTHDAAVVDDERAALNRRAAIAGDQSGAFIEDGPGLIPRLGQDRARTERRERETTRRQFPRSHEAPLVRYKPNTNRLKPAAMATYCRPSTA